MKLNVKKLIAKCSYHGLLDCNVYYDVAQVDYEFNTISLFLNNKNHAVINIPLEFCTELKFSKDYHLLDNED